MNKTKSKVLSLILASAMIVSSFSSLNFASAATTRTETGELTLGASDYLNSDDEIFFVSKSDSKTEGIDFESLIGGVDVTTYDNEDASDVEFDKLTHVSGDKLVTAVKDDDDYTLTLKKAASGKEVVNLRYTATYERDDKEYTVRASKDITIYADEEGEVFLGKYQEDGLNERPDDVPTVAVNAAYLDLAAYYAVPSEGESVPSVIATYKQLNLDEVVDKNGKGVYLNADKTINEDNLELKNSKKIFTDILLNGSKEVKVGDNIIPAVTTGSVIRLVTEFEGQTAKKDKEDKLTDERNKSAKLLSVGNNTLEMKLGQIDTTTPTKYADFDSSKTDTKVYCEKKFDADISLNDGFTPRTVSKWEINKKSGKTYLVEAGLDWDSSDSFKDSQKLLDGVVSVGSYDKILIDGSVTVLGGSIGDLEAADIVVEDGTTGYLKAPNVEVQDGSVGTIKGKTTKTAEDDKYQKIDISGGTVKEIDAEDADVIIDGGSITGNVVCDTIEIDAEDDDIDTIINGNVTVGNDEENSTAISVDSSSDAAVVIKGTLRGEKGDIELSGDNVTLGKVDVDYDNNLVMDDFTGTIAALINAGEDTTVEANGDTVVTFGGKLAADSLEIEEDSKVTVAEADLGALSGEGTFVFPAGKVYVEGGIDDSTRLVINSGLEVNATALTTGEGSVDGEDLTTVGFTLETKSVNSSTDKLVIKSLQFAGVQFDKTALTIAKGYSDTLTVSNYPTGTALPAGYSIEWDVDVNDDYITVTTEGNVATVKAVDYSTDRAIDNQGTISATVVDADGYEVEDLLVASINVTAIEKLPSTVTLDTTKPVTVGTGAVYQYIAKSSTGAVMTATSSDTQIATVELFNAADPRGYKFQVKGLAEGTATITTTDANGASATLTVTVAKVNGTLKADTTTYTFAPGKVYDVKFSTTGTTAVPVVTVNGKVVSIAPRGNGVYRVTAQNPGTAFVVATVGNTHVSVKFVVANGAASVGVKGNNVSTLK